MSNRAESGKRQPVLRKSPRLLGVTNPKSGSSQPALRKSSRLLAKSATTKPQRSRIEPCKIPQCSQVSTREHRKPTQSSKTKFLTLQTDMNFLPQNSHWFNRAPDFANIKREMRRTRDRQFHWGYNCFGMEKRTIIFSGGELFHCEKSTGVMWVAVRWMKSICVVYRNKDLNQEPSRLTGYLDKSTLPWFFAAHLICENEDIADLSSADDLSDGMPFAVVSVSPGPSNVHEETNDEASVAVPGENKAIEFLRGKINGGHVVTYSDVIKTAISALQYLFQQKFKGVDIRVVELKGDNMSGLMPPDIDAHLAIINRPDSPDSISPLESCGLLCAG